MSTEIEATGSSKDGRITVKAKLGTARLKLSWEPEVNDSDDVDVLIQAAPQVVGSVLESLVEAQKGGDHG